MGVSKHFENRGGGWGWGCLAQAPDTAQKFTGRGASPPSGSPSPGRRDTGFLRSTPRSPSPFKLPPPCRTRNPAPSPVPAGRGLAVAALRLRGSGLWLPGAGQPRYRTHAHTRKKANAAFSALGGGEKCWVRGGGDVPPRRVSRRVGVGK